MKRVRRLLALSLAVVVFVGVILPSSLSALSRCSGEDRYETAAEISRSGWVAGSEVVVLARGDDYADALTGVSLAYMHKAPILLTRPGSLPTATKAELQRLDAKTVYILGGNDAVSQDVEDDLKKLGINPTRIAGANRWETAAKIAREVAPNGVRTAFVVSGLDFPDALAAASYAASAGCPILLTDAKTISAPTAQTIQELGIEKTYVIGGTGVISDAVMDELPSPERIWGPDRYATAAALAARFVPHADRIYIASGASSAGGADAIAGAALAALNGTGILLVDKDLPETLANFLAAVEEAIVLGGPGAVSQAVLEKVETALKSNTRPARKLITAIEITGVDELAEVELGAPVQLTAEITPSDATYKKILWSIEAKTGSATVDENGLFTGKAPGTVTVKAAARDGSGVVGTMDITVTSPTWYFTFNSGEITGYRGFSGVRLHIPSVIDGIPVTSIGDSVFMSKDLPSVVIPDSVTSIGARAFQANALTNLRIPDSVVSIGDWAFSGNSLASVTMPDSLVTIGGWAFANNALTSIDIPDSVVSIGRQAFDNNNLESVIIPNGVETIGAWAFMGNSLSSVVLPDSVIKIDVGAFMGLREDAITLGAGYTDYFIYSNEGKTLAGHIGSPDPDLVIPEGAEYIENSAFAQHNLKTVRIPDTVTSIGPYAFNRNQLTSIIIPDSVRNIGQHAFIDNALTSVVIGNSVESIGMCAFWNNQLTTITIPDSVTFIGNSAFRLNNLRRITINGTRVSMEDRLLTHLNEDFRNAYETWGPGTYAGTQDGSWTKGVSVSGVTVDKTALTLTAGGVIGRLTAAVAPADAANKNVAWSSSDETVATVAGGVITPVSPGTTIITVITEEGGYTDTCTVTVEPSPNVAAISPATSQYDLAAPGNITTVVAWNDSQSIVGINDGSSDLSFLGGGSDCTVSAGADETSGVITINQSYFGSLTLAAGDTIQLDIVFNGEATGLSTATLTITIVDNS